ncbi:hypothetical protein ASF69_01780 [Rhizobium sp. Leaf311]|nr:hypothetical protein ASF69_01780 [Rhizobium sp. Leaf311]
MENLNLKRDLIAASHDRMIAARQKSAVYDGDLARARQAYNVGAGWHGILDDLVSEFAKIDGLGFLGAHEKWGGLRIAYLYSGDRQSDVDSVVHNAAERSLETCWHCGQPGKLNRERWWRVRCDEHWSAE